MRPTKQDMKRSGLEAASRGDLNGLKKLFDSYGFSYAKGENGLQLLLVAVAARRINIVKYLVKALAKEVILSEVEPTCRTIRNLTHCITTNIKNLVKPLLEGPPDQLPCLALENSLWYPCSDDRYCPLLFTELLEFTPLQIVHILLTKDYANSNRRPIYRGELLLAVGKDPLMESSKSIIEMLIDGHVGWADGRLHTALCTAILGRHWDIIGHFLRLKFHLDFREYAKCISFEVMKEIDKMFETFAAYGLTPTFFPGDNNNRFFKAIRDGDVMVLEEMLQSGDFVLTSLDRSAVGVSPLHVAAFYRNEDVSALLVRSGVDIFADEDYFGETPVDYAIRNKDLSILSLFLAHHGKVNDCALFTAARWDLPEVVEFLLLNGASVFVADDSGKTPLHVSALRNNNALCTKLLLESGSDPNARDNNGNTPLSTAKAFDTLEVLFNYGGDINLQLPESSTDVPVYGATPFISQTYYEYWNELRCNHPEHKKMPSLVQQLAKLWAANLPISEPNLVYWLTNENILATCISKQTYEKYISTCEKEVDEMKKTKLDCKTDSMYDILTASENKLAQIARNEAVMREVLLGKYSSKFPSYEGMIIGKLEVGKIRREFLEKSCKSMQNLFPHLPVPCIEKILHFLCNKDLSMVSSQRNVTTCFYN